MVDRKILEEILIKNCLIFHFFLGAGCRCWTGLCTRPTAAVPSRRGKAQHYSLIARCTWLFRAGKLSDFQTQRTVEDRKAAWFPYALDCSGQESRLISRRKWLWITGKQPDFQTQWPVEDRKAVWFPATKDSGGQEAVWFPDAQNCEQRECRLISECTVNCAKANPLRTCFVYS
jgi:hypothetical protein